MFVLQTCLSALVINYYKYFFITVKLRAIAVRNVLRQPLILPCSTCEAVRNFRYQRSCLQTDYLSSVRLMTTKDVVPKMPIMSNKEKEG